MPHHPSPEPSTTRGRPVVRRLVRHRDDVDPHRAQSRVAAYVYGNILVLTAVAGVSPHGVDSGTAIVVVAGTVLSTFLAHVLAHSIGGVLVAGRRRNPDATEFRDALPILSSGSLPMVILAAAAVGWLSPLLGQALASLVGLTRIFGTGLVYRRLQAEVPLGRSLWFGAAATAIAGVAVAVKLAVTH